MGATVPLELRELVGAYGGQVLGGAVDVHSGGVHEVYGEIDTLYDVRLLHEALHDPAGGDPWMEVLRGSPTVRFVPWATHWAGLTLLYVWEEGVDGGQVAVADLAGGGWQLHPEGPAAFIAAVDRGDLPADEEGVWAKLGIPAPEVVGYSGLRGDHDIGFLMPPQLGGSMVDARNLVPLHRWANRREKRVIDQTVVRCIQQGEAVQFNATPAYRPEVDAPAGVTVRIVGDRGTELFSTIRNVALTFDR